MEVVHCLSGLNSSIKKLREKPHPLGLVPTMGALHDGHLSLVHKAKDDGCTVVGTIFVNPTQFAAHEDLDQYPRTLNEDLAKFRQEGVDLVWVPDVSTIYPGQDNSRVQIRGVIAEEWEGKSRPAFFMGVATVVTKLFAAVGPDKAYFGEKDFQQLQVIKAMVRDFLMPIDVVGCPIKRDSDGLAMSSRNVYLNVDDRYKAPALYQSLQTLAVGIRAGKSIDFLVPQCTNDLLETGFTKVDYIAVVHEETLAPISIWSHSTPARILAAAHLGETRLIDNLKV